MPESSQYKQKAEECREQALLALSPEEKASWLAIAEEWKKIDDKLASIETHQNSK
jgi:hypothetical protein